MFEEALDGMETGYIVTRFDLSQFWSFIFTFFSLERA